MKNWKSALLLIAVFAFSACTEDVTPPTPVIEGNAYVVNYGSGAGELSHYNTTTDSLSNNYYKATNSVSLPGNLQYAYEYNNKVYLITNNANKLLELNSNSFVTENSTSDSLIIPRYCVGIDHYLWISCTGDGTYWTNGAAQSYLAKYNISTGKVEKKIPLPGGPEGLMLENGKLYAALNYVQKVAVIDLATETITYIATPAVTSYFVKDKVGNLYVTLINSFSNPSTTTGLGYINTKTNKLENTYALDNVSSDYISVLSINKDLSKIYIVASSYTANGKSGGVQVFDTNTKNYSSFISDVNGINGVCTDPENNNIYVLVSESYTAPGKMCIYNTSGTKTSEHSTGINPSMMLFKN